ncbi:MAG: PorT family protein [Raineya sp.]|nr:PorT family protein [Raineya sp.]
MKNLLVISIFVLPSFFVSAQKVYRFGAEFGVASSNPIIKLEWQRMSVDALGGFYARLVAERLLVSRLWLSSGLQYTRTGFSQDNTGYSDDVLIDNLGFPIWARYEVSPEHKKNKFFIQGGFYVNRSFRGILRSQYFGGVDTEELSFGNTPRQNFLRGTDFGFGVGLGWHFRFVTLRFHYDFGIRNLAPNGDDANMFKNRIFTANLGFSIPTKIGKKKMKKEEEKKPEKTSSEEENK